MATPAGTPPIATVPLQELIDARIVGLAREHAALLAALTERLDDADDSGNREASLRAEIVALALASHSAEHARIREIDDRAQLVLDARLGTLEQRNADAAADVNRRLVELEKARSGDTSSRSALLAAASLMLTLCGLGVGVILFVLSRH